MESFTFSDHKPVCSRMRVKVKKTDPEKKKAETRSILDYLQNLKDNFTPKLKLYQEEIIFKDARYGDDTTLSLTIENAGDGLLEFEIFRVI